MAAPTWVDGIGPPLEQIAEDCRDALTLLWNATDAERRPGTESQTFKDTLALIAEIHNLRKALESAEAVLRSALRRGRG